MKIAKARTIVCKKSKKNAPRRLVNDFIYRIIKCRFIEAQGLIGVKCTKWAHGSAVERSVHIGQVPGSNPGEPTAFCCTQT